MKQLFFLISACCLCTVSIAQTRATTTDYQKVSRPALVNDAVPFPAKTVENAIEDAFSKMGYKGTSSKGFTVYKGAKLAELGSGTYDFYFMADKKSRNDKENSIVTMMISKGFDAFISESSDEAVFGKARIYLDSLRNMLAAYDLEQQIVVQEEEVKKMDKKNTSLQDEGKDLLKKRRKLEDEIDDNNKAQEKQVKELEKQRQILDVMKAKRKH